MLSWFPWRAAWVCEPGILVWNNKIKSFFLLTVPNKFMFKKQQQKHRRTFVHPLHLPHFLYSLSEKLDPEGFLCITKHSEGQWTTHRGKRQGEMVFIACRAVSLCSSLPSECTLHFIGLGFVCVQPHSLFLLRENKGDKKPPNSNPPCRFSLQNSWIASSPPSLLQRSQF